MYNGIGLQTPRGSGTNGYIQTNKFFVKPRGGPAKPDHTAALAGEPGAGPARKPNKDILEHDRKRQIELRLLVLREALEDQGYGEDEIEERVAERRQALEAEAAAAAAVASAEAGGNQALAPPNRRFSDTQSHHVAARKEKQLETLRAALGITRKEENEGQEQKENESDAESGEFFAEKQHRNKQKDGSKIPDDKLQKSNLQPDAKIKDVQSREMKDKEKSLKMSVDKPQNDAGKGNHWDDSDTDASDEKKRARGKSSRDDANEGNARSRKTDLIRKSASRRHDDYSNSDSEKEKTVRAKQSKLSKTRGVNGTKKVVEEKKRRRHQTSDTVSSETEDSSSDDGKRKNVGRAKHVKDIKRLESSESDSSEGKANARKKIGVSRKSNEVPMMKSVVSNRGKKRHDSDSDDESDNSDTSSSDDLSTDTDSDASEDSREKKNSSRDYSRKQELEQAKDHGHKITRDTRREDQAAQKKSDLYGRDDAGDVAERRDARERNSRVERREAEDNRRSAPVDLKSRSSYSIDWRARELEERPRDYKVRHPRDAEERDGFGNDAKRSRYDDSHHHDQSGGHREQDERVRDDKARHTRDDDERDRHGNGAKRSRYDDSRDHDQDRSGGYRREHRSGEVGRRDDYTREDTGRHRRR